MEDGLLKINHLSVEIEGKEILRDITMSIRTGETHVLFGPNGSGKSTLLMTIMGFPKYKVTKGNIVFRGKDITSLPVDERARMGIGVSFQRPPIIRGVRTHDLLKACMQGKYSEKDIDMLAEKANMLDFMNREVNYGFSGGEIKRSEMMQLLAQSPRLSLLDEPESGVDLMNIAVIGKLVNELLEKNLRINNRTHAGLIITHTGHILEYVNARTGYVLINGRIIGEGDPHEILATIKERGYEKCIECSR
jgi:Fe-S cluster assembly ATP-binding protein